MDNERDECRDKTSCIAITYFHNPKYIDRLCATCQDYVPVLKIGLPITTNQKGDYDDD